MSVDFGNLEFDPKIGKPFVAINIFTDIIVKRFNNPAELAQYIYEKRDVPEVGEIQFHGLGLRPFFILEETEEHIRVAPIEFEFTEE